MSDELVTAQSALHKVKNLDDLNQYVKTYCFEDHLVKMVERVTGEMLTDMALEYLDNSIDLKVSTKKLIEDSVYGDVYSGAVFLDFPDGNKYCFMIAIQNNKMITIQLAHEGSNTAKSMTIN